MAPQAAPGPELHTHHLVHANHSLGYITGRTYHGSEGAGGASSSRRHCHHYSGLPYALPPTGAHRFRRPRPLPPCHRYGTQAAPGLFVGGAGVCPQPALRRPGGGGGGFDPQTWDEDCLQLGVWVPGGEPPAKGWPVYFFIHGGFLQFGTPNTIDAAALLNETDLNCIVVCPAYRVNVFGFLASRELAAEEGEQGGSGAAAGNYGFWDQRLALEWTRRFASYFGGDGTNITVGGHSAGAHSAFHQLAHDLTLPEKDRIVRRLVLLSNGPGVQPKAMPAAQEQFDALLVALGIPMQLSGPDKLTRLRALPPLDLLQAIDTLDGMHEFRATSAPGGFVSPRLFAEIDDGTFAARLRRGGVRILLGECRDEAWAYGAWRAPRADSFAAMRARLLADYPARPLHAALAVYCPRANGSPALPTLAGRTAANWRQAFGLVYADLQVHATQRGLVDKLHAHGAGGLVERYRVEMRARACDAFFPPAWGVTHGTDQLLWWFRRAALDAREAAVAARWLAPFARFLAGAGTFLQTDDAASPAAAAAAAPAPNARRVRRLCPDGAVDPDWRDPDADWRGGLEVWRALREAAEEDEAREARARL